MQTQQQKQVQKREQEALGAESCSGVGVTVKVMGEGGGGQWACHSSYQEGETLSDGKKIKKNLTHCYLGAWPSKLFLWLPTDVHGHACHFSWTKTVSLVHLPF